MKCPVCEKGTLRSVRDILYDFGTEKLLLAGERCGSCGEEFLSEAAHKRIYDTRTRLGSWSENLKLHRRLGRSGRQITVRIPVDIERALKLTGDEEIAFSVVGKRKILLEIGK